MSITTNFNRKYILEELGIKEVFFIRNSDSFLAGHPYFFYQNDTYVEISLGPHENTHIIYSSIIFKEFDHVKVRHLDIEQTIPSERYICIISEYIVRSIIDIDPEKNYTIILSGNIGFYVSNKSDDLGISTKLKLTLEDQNNEIIIQTNEKLIIH